MTRLERNLGAAVSAYNRVARRRGIRELAPEDVAHVKTRVQLGVFFATHGPGAPVGKPTHAEAMFLAQLLADPREYIRAAQERARVRGTCTPR